MVVAVFVLCIALGSFAVAALPRIPGGLIVATQWSLALGMGLLYAPLNYAPYWAHIVRTWFRDIDGAFCSSAQLAVRFSGVHGDQFNPNV